MSQTLAQKYETVIGLEVHLQMNTATKMFCGCQNLFGSEPNSNVCPVCLGLPGSLPVVNKQAIENAIKIGHALNCEINPFVKFDRKNYFYPDCPKNYQISQFDFPICSHGFIWIPQEDSEEEKKIRIMRAHLEEDAGKLIHDDASNSSLVDYNRTGTPLLEIVTEADIRSPQEAYDYLQTLKLILQYLDVSDCDMEKGSLRCDANISIREFGDEKFGTKTELKNMNSFRAVKMALEYEIGRHRQIKESGKDVIQETLLWNEQKGITAAMRSKEDAHDYRYFPEPDLVPFIFDEKTIATIKETLEELPREKYQRFIKNYQLSAYDARIVVSDKSLAEFFEECAKLYANTKKICNWINSSLLKEINERKTSLKNLSIKPQDLTTLIEKVEEGSLNNIAAKEVLSAVIDSDKTAEQIIKEKGLVQVSDNSTLESMVDELFESNPQIVEQIKSGKESAIGFFVGQAMKKSQGKANPKKIGEIIKRRLLS